MTTQTQFSPLDLAFADFLASRANSTKQKSLRNIIARLSASHGQGDSCMPLTSTECDFIAQSGVATAPNSPLVLENNHLYLQRYWFYECRLARQIKALAARQCDASGVDNLLALYFANSDHCTHQKLAVQSSASQCFSIISGGPGTGKTSTVLKILAVAVSLADKPLRIGLAASTGKAAMRLQQAIIAGKNSLASEVATQIPQLAETVHRLLGAQYNSPFFKHHADNPLPHDLLVVDEASMLDLALLSKLVDALKPQARLILLGDKDQLSSVESGAVLADLTASLPQNTHYLSKSYRFCAGIQNLADAVNRQQADLAWQQLNDGSESVGLLQGGLLEAVAEGYEEYWRIATSGADLTSIMAVFNKFQTLCSNRQGAGGVIAINSRLEDKMGVSGWYVGRPVLVLENNADIGLFNGDIGVCLGDSAGKLGVFFLDDCGVAKKISTSQIANCESAYAMTIHKSQGAEFDHCLCVLPDKANQVLGKELLYTAITRAKNKITIAAQYEIFCATVGRKTVRVNGLAARLR